MQEHAPHHALSRVGAYDNLGSFATVPLGQLALLPLTAALGSDRTAMVGAMVYATLAPETLAAPSVRNLRHRPTATVCPTAIAKSNAREST